MIVRRTRPEEAGRVNEIFSIAFDIPLGNCPADPANDHVFHYGAYEDDDRTMMGNITVNIYDISFDGNRCTMGGIRGSFETCVQKLRWTVEKTSLPPDARLTIQAFSALICGVMDLEEARYALEGLELISPEALEQVFYRKKRMITTYF